MLGVGLVRALPASCCALLFALALGILDVGAADGEMPETGTGELVVRVILVDADLALRPVPKHRFLVVGHDAATTTPVVTGFDGELDLTLPVGHYRIQSEDAVSLAGRSFTWDVPFVIEAASRTTVELSSDNAMVDSSRVPLAEVDEGEIYRQYQAGVFRVISDGGHGSGFLVDSRGLILTNHHVIHEAGYLAAKIDARRKVAIAVVAEDSKNDLALLRVHPDVVAGLPVLPLAADTRDNPSVRVGDEVLAIGSPLDTDSALTLGAVSKVDDHALYSDVNINPGNSGGPLLNRSGQVVGVSTFSMQGDKGPGLSGVTRIHLARDLIAMAQAALDSTEPPPGDRLPMESAFRFPPDVVRDMALAREAEPEDYNLDAGKIDVQLFTPVLMASSVIRSEREALEGRRKRRKSRDTDETYTPGAQFYEWTRDTDNFRPVVRVRAFPEVKMRAGSAWKVAFVGGAASYRFKTDFKRMELHRDGALMEPVHPGRIKEVVHVEGAAVMKDVGYWGYYEYRPEAFEPGAEVVLSVWEQDVSRPRLLTIPEDMLQRIWADFEPYRADGASRPGAPQTDG